MNIGVVVKVSKLCNLRCVYCCESADLANPARMSIQEIEAMFRRLYDFLRLVGSRIERHEVTFYWHGGEPFAQPIAYWTAIIDAQQRVFGTTNHPIRILNALQSNLSLITPRHLPLLRHFRLGFSFDVINELRIFANGRSSTVRVAARIDWLRSVGVPLAGIAVVSAANVNRPDDVASFYLERNLPFRFIQLDEGLEHLPNIHTVRVSFVRYLQFAFALYGNPMVHRALEHGLRIDPISAAAQSLVQPASGLTLEDCAEREHLLEVDTDGQVYSTADYPYRNSYGNIFSDSVTVLLTSEARQRRIDRSRQRMTEVCHDCFLFRRSCPGTWVAHATNGQYEEFRRQGGCEIRVIAQWISATERTRGAEPGRLPCHISTISTT